MARNLYVDLETCNVQPPMADVARSHITPAKNLKDPDKIAADIEAKLDKTALDGLWGEITAIGYALDDDEPIALVRQQGEPETLMLNQFKQHISSAYENRWHKSPPCLIGHNVQFDIRFLFQRMIVQGISIPWHWLPIHAKPWDHSIFDTMWEWAGPRDYVSLDALCAGLSIDVPETLPGAEIPAAWLRGDYEAMQAHVLADVEAVRQVHRRMTA